MAQVTTTTGKPVTPPLTLVIDGSVRLRIVPEPGERLPFAATTTGPTRVDVTVENRVAAHFAVVTIRGRAAGDTALEIASADGRRTAPLAIRVTAPAALPAADTDAGLLARLFLAEAPTPASLDDLPAIGEAITLMRVVLQNRLATPSVRWSSAGVRTLADVVRARGQFQGFGGYPTLPAKITDQIADILKIANTPSDPRSARMRAHVDQILAVANGPAPRDPTVEGLYWWRTGGSGPPGTGVVLYKTVKGNSFFREAKKP